MVARVLFILLTSCGNTITPTPRATIKALTTTPYHPRPYGRRHWKRDVVDHFLFFLQCRWDGSGPSQVLIECIKFPACAPPVTHYEKNSQQDKAPQHEEGQRKHSQAKQWRDDTDAMQLPQTPKLRQHLEQETPCPGWKTARQ